MNCQTAQHEMHRRLDAAPGESTSAFADLDAHLARCPGCSRAWLELVSARERLGNLRSDAPTPEEIDAMWQAIEAAVPAQLPAIAPPSRAVIFRFLSATGAVAACLFIAFMLGEQRYGRSTHAPASAQTRAHANLSRVGQSELTYASDPTTLGTAIMSAANAFRSPFVEDDRSQLQGLGYVGGRQERFAESTEENDKSIDLYFGGFGGFGGGGLGSDGTPSVFPPERGTVRTGRAREDANIDGVDDSQRQETTPLASKTEIGATHGLPRQRAGGVFVLSEEESPRAGIALGQDFAADRVERLQFTYPEPNAAAPDQANLTPLRAMPPGEVAGDFRLGREVYTDNETTIAGTEKRASKIGVTVEDDIISIHGDQKDLLAQTKVLYDSDDSQVVRTGRQHTDDSTVIATGQAAQPDAAPDPGAQARAIAQKSPAATKRPTSIKIIKTGSLATEVLDYEQAVEEVNAIIARFDCFLADASTKEAAGGALVGELVIRVTPEHFEPLFAELRQVGRLESEDIKSADVTAEYVDVEARIAALRITEERLIELIKSKTSIDRIDHLLQVEREMNRVRTEIEQHEGRLRVLADRVALSTISMTLREPGRTVPSASLAVEVPTLEAAAATLSEALVTLDARMTSGKTTQHDRGALVGEYHIKVSLARFGEALAAIARLGRVEARDVRDWREQSATAKWADRVTCDIALKLFERARDLPSGSMSLQIESLPEALAQLDELLPPSDAAITSSRTSKRNDGSSTADLQIRVPAGKFADLAAQLDTLGRVTAKQLTGEAGAITGGAADTPCTLSLTLAEPVRQIPSGGMVIEIQTFANARDRLAELVGKHSIQLLGSNSSQRTDGTWVGQFQLGIIANEMDAAVADLETLGKVSSREIRGIGLGELSRIDANALGVLDVILAEKSAINPGPHGGNSLRSHLRDGLTGLYDSLGLILYGLIIMAPWLVIAVTAAWLITRAWKRRKMSAQPSTKATAP